jgi:general secretion pathway protein A
VDEAQSLGADLLEELRLLSNMNDGKTLKLQILLSGQPDLYTLLQRVDMTQLAQRVVVDYHLQPLSETETANFIRHRVHIAGRRQPLFTDKASALIHRLSGGNPRLINQVSDITLTYGYAEQAPIITSKLVAQAALDRIKGRILPLAGKGELEGLATAPEDQTELRDSIPIPEPPVVADESPETSPVSPSEADYDRGMALKDDGHLKEAVDMFHSAAKDKALWLKAYAQIGFCYVKMREPHAAIQAFRTALNDTAALPGDMMDVLYFLGRSLESVGKASQALEIYHRIDQLTPSFRDVASRLRELTRASREAGRMPTPTSGKHSWFSGVVDNVQRFLIGSQK